MRLRLILTFKDEPGKRLTPEGLAKIEEAVREGPDFLEGLMFEEFEVKAEAVPD